MGAMHAQGGLPIPDIVHIEQPYWYENGVDVAPAEYGLRAARRARGEDRGARPGARRGLHRRAGAGRGRRDRAARDLLARDPAHLPRIRHPADRRRGHHRLRPHRKLVRLRILRLRAGLHDDRQGHHLRLPAARRRDGLRPRRGRADREGRRFQPRLHLVRSPGRLRGRDREPRDHAAREDRRDARSEDRALPAEALARARRPSAGRRGPRHRHAGLARAGGAQAEPRRSSATAARPASSAATTASRTAWSCGRCATP